ncbi:hypothetical protein [Marinobacter apostichopi]|uniref:hypothetical protein n=1 Tax=Marinobacter apostichopi TaxID=3035454 RepID=UPI002572384A|nr:hypothetical protein [Marinobacter sp. LA51]
MFSPPEMCFSRVRLFFLVFGLSLTLPVVAQQKADGDTPDRVGASLQLYLPDDRRGTDTSSIGYDAFYERELKRSRGFWRVRIFHEILETTDRFVSDFYRRGVGVDYGQNWGLERGFSAGAFVGGGWVNNDVVPDDGDASDWFGTFGLQVTSPALSDTRLKVRGSLRANYDNYQGGVLDWQGGISFVLPLR